MQKWDGGTSFRPLFCFLYEVKAIGLQLRFNIFTMALNLPYNKNKLYKTLDYWSRNMLNFDFLEKGLGIAFPPHFVYDFSKKIVSHVIFYYLTKFHCLIASTSWDIGQYVYSNCFFLACDVTNFELKPYLLNQAVFLHDQNVKTKS